MAHDGSMVIPINIGWTMTCNKLARILCRRSNGLSKTTELDGDTPELPLVEDLILEETSRWSAMDQY
jgi:hypothetical protein